MKLCFSTLGCPEWSWDEVFSAAKDLGLDGVEIRGLGNTLYAPAIKEFSAAHIENTMADLKRMQLKIPVLSSGAALASETAIEGFVEASAYINLAAHLGVQYVRVLGTAQPYVTPGDFQTGAKLYGLLCEYGALYGVTPLIETNGDLASSHAMLAFLERAGSENTGVLWDLHHTVRVGGETPEETVSLLGDYIKHVHVKDSSVAGDGTVVYKMLGYGDIPLENAVEALKKSGYDGFISLEWVKRWKPDLTEAGVVFAHYASYMKQIL